MGYLRSLPSHLRGLSTWERNYRRKLYGVDCQGRAEAFPENIFCLRIQAAERPCLVSPRKMHMRDPQRAFVAPM
jgi:hypothetical protein